jgi:hypothetical protein
MMLIGRDRLGLLFLGAQGVHLGLDRRRADEGRFRGVNPRGGGQRADDAVDSSISSRSACFALFSDPRAQG